MEVGLIGPAPSALSMVLIGLPHSAAAVAPAAHSPQSCLISSALLYLLEASYCVQPTTQDRGVHLHLLKAVSKDLWMRVKFYLFSDFRAPPGWTASKPRVL